MTVMIEQTAPIGHAVTDYDRRNLPLYASLLDAADHGFEWRTIAADVMHIDTAAPGAEACCRSHLERARWIVGEGLAEAIVAFGALSVRQGSS